MSGLSPEPSTASEGRLRNELTKINTFAARLANDLFLKQGLDRSAFPEIRERMREEFPASRIREISKLVAEAEAKSHARKFWNALGRRVGLQFVIPKDDSASVLAKFDVRPKVAAPSPEISALADQFARENAAKITVLRNGITPGLAASVRRAVEQGVPPDKLASHLRSLWREFGVPSRIPVADGRRVISLRDHAKFIAADQMGTLNSQLTIARFDQAGIKRAKWITQGDSKVRPEHRSLNNRTFRISTGVPGVGKPGEPPRCRCRSEPIINRAAVRAGFEG